MDKLWWINQSINEAGTILVVILNSKLRSISYWTQSWDQYDIVKINNRIHRFQVWEWYGLKEGPECKLTTVTNIECTEVKNSTVSGA